MDLSLSIYPIVALGAFFLLGLSTNSCQLHSIFEGNRSGNTFSFLMGAHFDLVCKFRACNNLYFVTFILFLKFNLFITCFGQVRSPVKTCCHEKSLPVTLKSYVLFYHVLKKSVLLSLIGVVHMFLPCFSGL